MKRVLGIAAAATLALSVVAVAQEKKGPAEHTMTGCVIGAGAARRASAVRWGVAGDVAVAWVITIPASALVAAIFYWLVSGEWLHVLISCGLIGFFAYFASAWRTQT